MSNTKKVAQLQHIFSLTWKLRRILESQTQENNQSNDPAWLEAVLVSGRKLETTIHQYLPLVPQSCILGKWWSRIERVFLITLQDNLWFCRVRLNHDYQKGLIHSWRSLIWRTCRIVTAKRGCAIRVNPPSTTWSLAAMHWQPECYHASEPNH